MAITNFIPEVWSANLLLALRDQLVWAQDGIINRNYEGEISQAGDTVHITSIGDPEVREYTRNAGNGDTPGIQYDLLNDYTEPFVVAQSDYFAFQVDDLDRRQAMSGFVEEASVGASYNLSAKADGYVASKMVAGVDPANKLGPVTVAVNTSVAPSGGTMGAYDLMVWFRTRLNRTKTPSQGRWSIVPPEFYALLLKDDRFIRADASGTTEGLRNGYVGRAAGFDIMESNDTPESGGRFDVMAGHSIATTWAQQILNTEALRLHSGFSDAVRGLHVYDAKVLEGRRKNLASAEVAIG